MLEGGGLLFQPTSRSRRGYYWRGGGLFEGWGGLIGGFTVEVIIIGATLMPLCFPPPSPGEFAVSVNAASDLEGLDGLGDFVIEHDLGQPQLGVVAGQRSDPGVVVAGRRSTLELGGLAHALVGIFLGCGESVCNFSMVCS